MEPWSYLEHVANYLALASRDKFVDFIRSLVPVSYWTWVRVSGLHPCITLGLVVLRYLWPIFLVSWICCCCFNNTYFILSTLLFPYLFDCLGIRKGLVCMLNCSYPFSYYAISHCAWKLCQNQVHHHYLPVVDAELFSVVSIDCVVTNYAFYFQVNASCQRNWNILTPKMWLAAVKLKNKAVMGF